MIQIDYTKMLSDRNATWANGDYAKYMEGEKYFAVFDNENNFLECVDWFGYHGLDYTVNKV